MMIGKKVFVCYTEIIDEKEKSVETTGHIMDKVLVSVVNQNGQVLSFDNYLVKKEDGTCVCLHPSYIVKIDD